MSHGLYTERDFQISLEMAWHKLTKLAKPSREQFPDIQALPVYYGPDATPLVIGNKRYVVPVAMDDGLPVAEPYCGERNGEETGRCAARPGSEYTGTYTLFTPRQAWDWVAEILAGTGYNVQSQGMLWNRSIWFMSVQLVELADMKIGDGRETKFQLNFSGGLDKSLSPRCELSTTVVVCWNTLSISRATSQALFMEKLTRNFASRLDAAKGEVAKAVGMAAVFQAAMDQAAQRPCNPARAERIFAGYVTPAGDDRMSSRTRNTVEELAALHSRGLGNRGQSEFDLLNAYTQRATHGAADSKVPMGRRFASSEFDSAADAKADFYRLITGDRATIAQVEDRGGVLLAN